MKTNFRISLSTVGAAEVYIFIGVNILDTKDDVNSFISELIQAYRELVKFRDTLSEPGEEEPLNIRDYVTEL